jgi:hypothetical protein
MTAIPLGADSAPPDEEHHARLLIAELKRHSTKARVSSVLMQTWFLDNVVDDREAWKRALDYATGQDWCGVERGGYLRLTGPGPETK